ncbi:MAG TPA: TMEM175 family protein [Burkholderiales bacterium]|nr:TMEM175 family protein [Burkholderiales bacterium]
MGKGRMEAFTDGVLAVIITILVLEMKVPHDADPAALAPLVPVFLSYVLSFVMIGIYWNNHHHMFHAVHRISGGALWANLHLLFWLSLVPFVTGWMDENHFAPLTVAAYGAVLIGAAIAYTILTRVLLRLHERDSTLAKALGRDFKGWLSLAIYLVAIALAFFYPLASCGLYVVVAAIWLCPDQRFEKLIAAQH